MGTVKAGQMVVDVLLNTEEGKAAIKQFEAQVKASGVNMETALKNMKVGFDPKVLDQTAQKSANARMGLLQLSYGMQDASYIFVNTRMGLMGISNNLDMLVQSMVLAKAEAKATNVGFGTLLMNTIKGPTGLILGFSILMGIIQSITFATDRHTKSANTEAEAMKNAKDALQKYREELEKSTTGQVTQEKSRVDQSIKNQENYVERLKQLQKDARNEMAWYSTPAATSPGATNPFSKQVQTGMTSLGVSDTDEINGIISSAEKGLKTLKEQGKIATDADTKNTKEQYSAISKIDQQINDLKKQQGQILDADANKVMKMRDISDQIATLEEKRKNLLMTTAELRKREVEQAKKLADAGEKRREELKGQEDTGIAYYQHTAGFIEDQYKNGKLTADEAIRELEAVKDQFRLREDQEAVDTRIRQIQQDVASKQDAASRKQADAYRQRAQAAREQQQIEEQTQKAILDTASGLMEVWSALDNIFGRSDAHAQRIFQTFQSLVGVVRAIESVMAAINAIKMGTALASMAATGPPSILTLLGLGITPFAEGGVVTKPTLALVGEGGSPEIIRNVDSYIADMQRTSLNNTDVIRALSRVEQAVGSINVNLSGVERLKGSDLVMSLNATQRKMRGAGI